MVDIMLYMCVDDFLDHVDRIKCGGGLTRQEEKEYAARFRKEGDEEAKQMLVNNYLPAVCSYFERYVGDDLTLDMVYRGIDVLERLVERSDFEKDREFINELSSSLRCLIPRYIANGY